MAKNNLIEYLYIIKIEYKGKIFGYKIGEYDGGTRTENLIKKYQFNANPTILISDIELPHNYERRLQDKDVHKKIIADEVFVNLDKAVIRDVLSESDGKHEFFRLYDGRQKEFNTDEKIINYIKSVVEELGKNEDNFKAKLSERKDIRLQYNGQTHLVKNYYINKILQKSSVYEDIKQNILCIGQFHPDFIASLSGYNDVAILYDDKDQKTTYIDAIEKNLTYCYSIEEVIKMCKKFNYIIANPPYGIGNELTKTVIENVSFDKYINLMPASKYKSKELYKYVTDIERVEDTFEDATVGDSLTLATLNRTAVGFNSFEELEMCKFEPKLLKFYKGNLERKNNINYIYLYRQGCNTREEVREALDKLNSNYHFYMLYRTADHGIHTDDSALDRIWNLGTNVSPKVFDVIRQGAGYGSQGGYIFFNSKNEKDNFTDFWYRNGKNGLMHKLIKGLNKSSGTIELAIPRVDWTRKWTDEEILKEYGYTEEEIKEILK